MSKMKVWKGFVLELLEYFYRRRRQYLWARIGGVNRQ